MSVTEPFVNFVRQIQSYTKKMKKTALFLTILFAAISILQSCDDGKTYAELLEEQKESINNFIREKKIKVISRDQFLAQDSTTNVEENEYVLFADNGLYMQIEYKGEGRKIENREKVLVRFVEYSLHYSDTTLTNIYDAGSLDEFTYTKSESGSQISATFGSDDGRAGYLSMTYNYGTSVPSGWLIPLEYINLTRNAAKTAKVNVIVPAKLGQATAIQNVHAYHYELNYQLAH